eukprot:XP_011618984.1 PREDICTED: synaptopodin 2-like protein [Takifugu rubripes]
MVAEEIMVTLSGGAPWGFRLQGGAEQQTPLQVAKVRRRSKACRGGLRENDELVAIGQRPCAGLSHADAMSLIDTQSPTLSLKVKRAPPGFLSPNGRCAPRLSPCAAPSPSHRAASLPPAGTPSGLTSPPDSEAYDGETDSDADMQALTHRRQRRTPPHARSPARYDNQDEEETSEMSGYESATDAGLSLQGQWDGVSPHREPLHSNWTGPEHTPNPHTLTAAPADQAEAEGEGDSGFQEVGVCSGLPCPPLVSPERAKEARMLGHLLVPMVGPQQSPVNHELSTSYMDKARQAKLQRGESQVEKQVKEARTKCRSIASLLTDAPNPNSKGVLMFKKRRQRAKKFTLTCFGKAEGDRGGDTEGETEEEGGSSIQSGSEVDEAGFSASFDPTWDAGYLDLLDRRSSACPSTTPTTPTTPTANRSLKLDPPAHQPSGPALVDPSPGLEASALERSASQGSGLENRVTKQPIDNMSPPAVALTNGGSVAVSRASVVLSAPSRMPLSSQNGHRGSPDPSRSLGLTAATDPDHMTANVSPNQSVLNRTARPFTPGTTPSRPTVTSVMFRPPQPKPAVAVSMVTIQPTPHAPEPKRAVSSTSLYIPSRNNSSNAPPPVASPPSALPFAPLPQPGASPSTFFPCVFPSPPQPFCPPSARPAPPAPPQASPLSPPPASDVALHMKPYPAPPPATPPAHPYIPTTGAVPPSRHAAVATAPPVRPAAGDPVVAREQRIAVPAARTGVLTEARRRSNKKPMFAAVQVQDVSPNPDLMSMVHNMDGHCGRTTAAEPGVAPSGEAGHESGPEEDWLRLGAEACNFMQAQRGPRPPPVAPKPQSPQVPQLAGKGGQLFARRQNRMDRYVVERAPSVAAAPYSAAQTREPSPTPSLPAAWKYSSNIRAPPPISYNPLLSPSCPPQAQKKPQVQKLAGSKGQKATKPVDVMSHQPYQLNSSLFSYTSGAPPHPPPHQPQWGAAGGPQKTARVCEIKRFSTPPPSSTGPALKVIVPRSATSLGEQLRRSDITSPPPTAFATSQPHWATSPLSPPPPPPPAPTAPLPQLPSFTSPAPAPVQPPTFSHLQGSCSVQGNKPFMSAPDLSPQRPSSTLNIHVPRPRFSTSNLGLQPSVWRPGSTLN